jgi:hypothetical protein
MSTPYLPPVARLLELGEEGVTRPWMDYLELGLGPDHVPDLVRLATDEQFDQGDDEGSELWAPVHAWRALGQLRAEAAVEPLLELADRLEEDDYAQSELGIVLGMIGPAALPALARVVTDVEANPWVRTIAVSGLDELAKGDESARGVVVPVLLAAMEKWEGNGDLVNAYLVDLLVELRVVEAAPLMEQAFAAGSVDVFLRGDWEAVQVELGLLEKRRTPSPRLFPKLDPFAATALDPGPAPRRTPEVARAKKNKLKQQKESRKKNRRRK